MSRHFYFLPLLALAACGGEDSSPTVGGPSDTNQSPSVTFTASSQNVEAGETVVFSATGSDPEDGTLTATVTCDAGTVVDNGFLLTEDVAGGTDISCTASVQDAAGATAQQVLTISVAEPIAKVALGGIEERPLQQGQTALLFIEGLDTTDVSATYNERDVAIDGMGGGNFFVTIPSDTPAGDGLLVVTSDSRTYAFEAAVEATTLDRAALDISNDFVDLLTVEIERAKLNFTLSASETAAFDAYLSSISNFKAGLGAAASADVEAFATFVVANQFDDLSAKTGLSCIRSGKVVAISSVLTALGGNNAAVSIAAGELPASELADSAGIVGLISMLNEIDNVGDCFATDSLELVEVEPPLAGTGAKAALSVQTLETPLDFRDGETKRFKVKAGQAFAAEDLQDLVLYADYIREVIAELKFVPQALRDIAEQLQPERQIDVSADLVTVAKSGGQGVTLASTASNGELVLTATVSERPSANVPFEVSFSYDGVEAIANATLVAEAPVAFNVAATITAGEETRIPLNAEGAASYVLVAAPQDVTVTIDNATGEAVVTTDVTYSGQFTFNYKAVNEAGESNVASVLVQVQPDAAFKYSGDYEIVYNDADSQFFFNCQEVHPVAGPIKFQSLSVSREDPQSAYELFFDVGTPSSDPEEPWSAYGSTTIALGSSTGGDPAVDLDGTGEFSVEVSGGFADYILDVDVLESGVIEGILTIGINGQDCGFVAFDGFKIQQGQGQF